MVKYLKKLSVVTGPLPKNSSYSHLGGLRKSMFCQPGFTGDEKFLVFGRALHEVWLEGTYESYNQLLPHLQRKVDAMVAALEKHPVARKLRIGAVCENKLYGKIFDMEFSYILDIKQPAISTGADLKTTVCKDYASCVAAALDYGYPGQALIYKTLGKVKEFFFIFINKEFPYEIFIVDSKEFKAYDKYAMEEIKFLTYFYKHYGNII